MGFLYMVFGTAGNRRFWEFGRPRRPQNPSKRWGASPPHLLEWFLGRRGHPDPQNDRLPILIKIIILISYWPSKRALLGAEGGRRGRPDPQKSAMSVRPSGPSAVDPSPGARHGSEMASDLVLGTCKQSGPIKAILKPY